MTGSFTETAADLRRFADQGWLIVSVEYSLFCPDRPTWNRAPEEVACALVWVSHNACRLGGDPKRVAVMGDSAGGNFAINLGYAAAAGRAPPAAKMCQFRLQSRRSIPRLTRSASTKTASRPRDSSRGC